MQSIYKLQKTNQTRDTNQIQDIAKLHKGQQTTQNTRTQVFRDHTLKALWPHYSKIPLSLATLKMKNNNMTCDLCIFDRIIHALHFHYFKKQINQSVFHEGSKATTFSRSPTPTN